MKMSLRSLLLWVTFAALVAAALARPSLLWTRLLFTATIVFLVWALIGALATRGNQRVFWIGAIAFGLAYGLLFSGSRSSPYGGETGFELGRVLVTQQLLDLTAQAIGHTDTMGIGRTTVWDPSIFWQQPQRFPMQATVPVYATPQVSYAPVYNPVPAYAPVPLMPPTSPSGVYEDPNPPSSTLGEDSGPPTNALDIVVPSIPPQGTALPPQTAYPVSVYDPYATAGGPSPGTYGQFLISGHCAFLILIAVVGGALARWQFGREESQAAT